MIELLIDSRRRRISSFEVGGPFIFFDHLGPVDLPVGVPNEADVLPHPDIGLSSVTCPFAGEIPQVSGGSSSDPVQSPLVSASLRNSSLVCTTIRI